jgi:DNA-binding beta-propeller fold protein YncE
MRRAAMNTGKWAWILLIGTPLVEGCGDFWQSPYGSTTKSGCTTNCSTTPPANTSGNFYIVNQETKQIAAYNIVSGKLTTISGSPYSLSAKPYAVAVAPSGSYLYVSTANGIYLYNIDSTTGALTLSGTNGGSISSDFATVMQVDSTGSWLVTAGSSVSQITAIPIDSSTGLEGTGGDQHAPLPAGTVYQLAISPDNGHVFVAVGTGGTMEVPFLATDTNPLETSLAQTIPVKNAGGSALSVAVDPDTRVFYIGETLAGTGAKSGGLRVFNYASLSSTLVESPGSPYPSGGVSPNAILAATSGQYTYVANDQGASAAGNIAGFTLQVSESAYTLTTGSTTAAGKDPIGLAEESTGAYVLLIDSGGSPDLEAFTFDSTTAGKLDSALSAATGTDPVQAVSIAAAP